MSASGVAPGEERTAGVGEGDGLPGVQRMQLEPLSDEAVRGLVRALQSGPVQEGTILTLGLPEDAVAEGHVFTEAAYPGTIPCAETLPFGAFETAAWSSRRSCWPTASFRIGCGHRGPTPSPNRRRGSARERAPGGRR